MSRGGGVFVCSPQVPWDDPADWTATNEWLTELGARSRWEVFQDNDRENIARDVMGCALSWSGNVSPPVDEGGGGRTPDELMNPPVQAWEPLPPQDWDSASAVSDVPDQSQTRGIIGAPRRLDSCRRYGR